jgi:hypothetical protein
LQSTEARKLKYYKVLRNGELQPKSMGWCMETRFETLEVGPIGALVRL